MERLEAATTIRSPGKELPAFRHSQEPTKDLPQEEPLDGEPDWLNL